MRVSLAARVFALSVCGINVCVCVRVRCACVALVAGGALVSLKGRGGGCREGPTSVALVARGSVAAGETLGEAPLPLGSPVPSGLNGARRSQQA